MTGIFSIALAGLQAATQRFSAHAGNIANLGSEGYVPVRPIQTTGPTGEPVVKVEPLPPGRGAPDSSIGGFAAARAQQRLPGTDFVVPQSDLATEMVGTMVSETAYKASAKLIKTQRELDDALLDILS